jgi:hypothetical protein
MSDLNSFIKKNSQFLRINEGETVRFVYKGYSIIPDRFNPGKEVVSYLFQYPDSNKTIAWNKGSNRVAAQMQKFATGDTLVITRFGEGPDTKYVIKKEGEPLSTVKKPPVDDDPVPF